MSESVLSAFDNRDPRPLNQSIPGQAAQKSADAGLSKPASSSPPSLPNLLLPFSNSTNSELATSLRSAFSGGLSLVPDDLRSMLTDWARSSLTINDTPGVSAGGKINFQVGSGPSNSIFQNSIASPSDEPQTPRLDAFKARQNDGTSEETSVNSPATRNQTATSIAPTPNSISDSFHPRASDQSDLNTFTSRSHKEGESANEYSRRMEVVNEFGNMGYTERIKAMRKFEDDKLDVGFARTMGVEPYAVLTYANSNYIDMDARELWIELKDTDSQDSSYLLGGSSPQLYLGSGEDTAVLTPNTCTLTPSGGFYVGSTYLSDDYLYVDGSAYIDGDETVTGNLDAGSISTGSLSIGSLEVTDSADIGGDLRVGGNLDADSMSTRSLSADYAQINGNLDVSSNENVSGNLDANTISTRSLSSDYAQINGNLDVSSNENVSGNLDANTISTRSLSSDYAQINGNLDVSGQATVGGDLGAHTLSATEDISGRDLYVRDIFARDITALSGFYGLYLQLSGDIDAQSGRFRGNVDGDSGSFNTLSIGGSSLDDYIRDIISGLSWTATCNSDGTITITAD